ncbi:MAG: GtrA family protein [bacterium]
MWIFVKNNFLTRKFLTFGIIGVINTAIDAAVYMLADNVIGLDSAFLSKSLAFIIASVFSYFANAIFTFKPASKNAKQFSVVMLVFLVRMLISAALAEGVNYALVQWLAVDYAVYPAMETIVPILSSAVMIPIAYFALDVVYKKYGAKPAE